MSESEFSVEVAQPKFNGYTCERCNYKTKRLKSFINHITRKIPCNVVKNYEYGVQKALERYDKKSREVLDMLDQLENGEDLI